MWNGVSQLQKLGLIVALKSKERKLKLYKETQVETLQKTLDKWFPHTRVNIILTRSQKNFTRRWRNSCVKSYKSLLANNLLSALRDWNACTNPHQILRGSFFSSAFSGQLFIYKPSRKTMEKVSGSTCYAISLQESAQTKIEHFHFIWAPAAETSLSSLDKCTVRKSKII